MRTNTYELLLLAAASTAFAKGLVRRQFSGIPTDVSKLQTLKPKDVKQLTPNITKEAIREQIRWGPFDLQPSNASHPDASALDAGGDAFAHNLDGFCKDCMVLIGYTDLTYEDGSKADIGTGVYNHHIYIGDVGKQPLKFYSCLSNATDLPHADLGGAGMAGLTEGQGVAAPAGGMGDMGGMRRSTSKTKSKTKTKRAPDEGHGGDGTVSQTPGANEKMSVQIIGSGDDGAPIDYHVADAPDTKSGFYVAPTDVVTHSSEFVNYKPEKQSVYLTVDYEYVKGRPAGYGDAMMSQASVMGCSNNVMYYPPPNQTTTLLSPSYTVTTPGTLFNAQAHLHDGGVNVRLWVNRKLVCDSPATYGGGEGATVIDGKKWETIQGYKRCTNAVKLNKGDEMMVESTYDLVEHRLRPGSMDHSMGAEAMGLMGFVFAEDAGAKSTDTNGTAAAGVQEKKSGGTSLGVSSALSTLLGSIGVAMVVNALSW